MSLISLPLKAKDKVFGFLAMYGSETRDIVEQEVSLLQELAENLAAGIINIRLDNERQLLNSAMLQLAKSVNVSTGDGFFEKLVTSMVETSSAQAGYIARLLPEKPLRGRMLSAIVDGKKVESFDYLIPERLVEALLGKSEMFIVSRNAHIDYPNISMMRFYPYQAFAALRLQDSMGELAGLILVFFQQPIQENSLDLIKSTLKIFAARTASELERMESNDRIHEQASLLDKTRDAVVVTDMNNCITFWNKGAENLYGWTSKDAIQQPIQELLKHDLTEFKKAINELMNQDEWVGEMTESHQDGSILIVETRWTLMRDHDGKPKSIFAIQSDITTRKIAENKILEMAFYDYLTNLPNRRLLMDRLENALTHSIRSKSYGALMFIDLDNFKTLNDTLGHDIGDSLLKETAMKLRMCVRDEDTVARLGGDEFVVMIENLSNDLDQASTLALMIGNKILSELNHTADFDGYMHISTPSIGVTLFNNQTKNLSELIKQADTAMYKSKTAGRNRLSFYNEGTPH